MSFGNRDYDRADQLAEAERANSVARAQASLEGAGEHFCVDCGIEIPAARRTALPSARRCITCAGFVERGEE